MVLIGINFTKISASKAKPIKGKVNINSNITLMDVKSQVIKANAKQSSLKYLFKFTAKFEPKLGEIELEGKAVYLEEAKKAKDVAEIWKKTKKLPQEDLPRVMNSILQKSNVIGFQTNYWVM